MEILGREGVYKRTAARFYVAVVKSVLLFGYNTWVLTPRLEKALAGFHHQAAWRMAAMVPKRQLDGRGFTHPLERHCKWCYWRRLGSMFPTTRTRSHNKLRPVLLWTCVWQRSGIRECAYPGNGGNSPP